MQSAALEIEVTRHGYDGMPPELVAPHDLAGAENVRELPERENYNTDRIHWLFRHKMIDAAQYFAGVVLQKDHLLAKRDGYASPSGGVRSIGMVPSNLADAKCDAIARKNEARAAIVKAADETSWKLLEMVVLENIQHTVAAKLLWGHSRHREPIIALKYALNLLAKHYGLTT